MAIGTIYTYPPSFTSKVIGNLTSPANVTVGLSTILGGYHIYNGNTSGPVYVQLFDAPSSANVSIGNTTPLCSFGVLAGNTSTRSCNIGFNTGLVAAATLAPTGATVVATGVTVSFDYIT